MKKHVKLLALVLGIAMVVSVFAGCAKKSTTSTGTTGTDTGTTTTPATTDDADRHYAVDKDTVVIATADETPSVTSFGHNAVAGDYVNKLVYNGLMKLDKDLNPQCDLAENYTTTDQADGSVLWTFNLKQGVKFHDGTELHAEDVVASLNNAKNSPDVASYASSYDNVTAVSDYVVTMTTAGPSAALLYDLCHHGNYIIPKALLDSGNDFNANPIGTGPYKFVSWTISEQLEFTAFEDYFDKDNAPKIKNIVWKIIPEGATRTLALESHEVDYVIELDSNDMTRLSEDSATNGITVMNVPSVSHNWLCLNNTAAPFDNVNLRKAINCAINKEDVVKVALNGAGVVATAQTPAGMLGENTEGFDGYDVEKAKQYLKDSGVDPSTVKLEMICSNDTKRRAASVIQANLKDVLGIDSEIVSMDLATYLSQTAAGNFTGFIGGYSSDEMMSFLKGVYLSSNIGSSNKTRTNDPKLDELINKACATVDQGEREKVLQEATAYLNSLCPQIPLYQDSTLSAHNSYLQGCNITGAGSFVVSDWYWG